jgi:hypothetical protein
LSTFAADRHIELERVQNLRNKRHYEKKIDLALRCGVLSLENRLIVFLAAATLACGPCAVFSEFIFSVTFFIRRERSRAGAVTPNDDLGMDPRDNSPTPGYFSGNCTGLLAEYFDVMHESFLAKLEMNIPVREIRTQAGVFLDKLGTLSEALVLVARAAQAVQRENIYVAELQERVRLRNEDRTGRVVGKGSFASLKRSRDDAGLEATGVWCPW